MEPSDSGRSESSRNHGQFDDVLEEVFLLDDIWTTAWEEPNASEDGMAENQEDESSSAPLDR
ncbi:uncharacterized protein FMAN_12047 [Fusarium mangiferae]|uniref:Uncharacterized protein n=1 Tax=Fusarium mangiferae TaxID=192010 RepID=A0A1L7UIH6_FUSMA|nr:uncharacterized protein FMAN_12047 [Fusarium mangiferae]CVL06956.1 uncharacterized protein FMAN_12047 [Fusarium mangiferae]